VVEVAEEGDLLEDVGLDAGDAVEEEEGEDAGRDTEGGADGAPVCAHIVSFGVSGGVAICPAVSGGFPMGFLFLTF
jgi:hypothetical protein